MVIPDVCDKAYKQSQIIKGMTIPSINYNLCLAEELNMFFSCFDTENKNNGTVWPALSLDQHESLIFDTVNFRRVSHGVNVRKAAGPDSIPGRVLWECADQHLYPLLDLCCCS